MSKIIIGTSNPGKIREIASILSPLGYEIEPHALDVQETGKTIKDNAILKATVYSKEYPDTYVIAEDSGLVVPGLNNLPGPYSARFHEITIDNELNVTNVPHEEFTTDKSEHDKLNNEKLLHYIKRFHLMNDLHILKYVLQQQKWYYRKTFSGYSYGYILDELRGTNGFGYDPIFVGDNTFGKTYAELDSARKI